MFIAGIKNDLIAYLLSNIGKAKYTLSGNPRYRVK